MMSTIPIVSTQWLTVYYGVEIILSRSAELSQKNVLLSTSTMLCTSKSHKAVKSVANRPPFVHLAPRRGQMSCDPLDPTVLGGP